MEPKDRTSTLLFQDDTHLGGDPLVMSRGKKTNKHKIWKYTIEGEIFKIRRMFNNCLL